MLSPRPQTRGVTLIELAVTLTVLGLLLMAVMPSVGVWIRNTQVRNTASSMLAGMQLARNEAIRRNAAVRFSLVSLANSTVMDSSCALASSGVSWVVSVRDPAGNCQYTPAMVAADATDPMIVQTNAGGVGGTNVVVEGKLADGSAGASSVTFNGFGRVEGASPIGFINVRNETTGNDYRNLRIELAPGGSVRMCDLAVTATTDPRYCPTRGTP
ncbi:MAG: GspH/FimT family pseudopilin [Aquincola sp.]|nr:GspH/FimT family pseudopilin [Aquincola sp.]MDH4287598.1 GspH/FimT family pseudopilin [Aquincola sp.]MDH5330803.1 GspH/FimT family pseudopilin [Aquincola sp.]